MTLFRVVWDQEYNNNYHDEILSDWLTEEKAKEFVDGWVERKLDSLKLPKSGENISALRAQLCYQTKDFDPSGMEISKGLAASIEDGVIARNSESQRCLNLGFGNKEYIQKCMEENKEFLNMLRAARINGRKVRIVIE